MKFTPALAFIAFTFLAPTAFSQSSPREEDWTDLVDEPSRHELLHPQGDVHATVIPPKFVFPQDTLADANGVPRKNAIFGLDISHYDRADFPFAKLKSQNIRFVYAKATQGIGHKDGNFARYWAAMNALPPEQKILRGAYHFLSASDDPVAQAERFVAFVNLQGGFQAGDMPPVMDLEWDKASANAADRWSSHSAKEIVSIALAFLNRVEQLTGRVPMMYSARSWFRERGIPDSEISKFAKYAIWAADYSKASLKSENPGSPGNAKPALWQFSESSTIAKIYPEAIDASIFRGTEQEFLIRFIGK